MKGYHIVGKKRWPEMVVKLPFILSDSFPIRVNYQIPDFLSVEGPVTFPEIRRQIRHTLNKMQQCVQQKAARPMYTYLLKVN